MGYRFYVAALAVAATAFLVDHSEELFGVALRVAVQVSPYAKAVDAEHPPQPEMREAASGKSQRGPALAETLPPSSAGEAEDEAQAGRGETPLRRHCWSPAELSGSPREEKSIKGVSARRVPPREEALPPKPKLDGVIRGVIRRVEPGGTAKPIALTFNLNEQVDEIGGYDGRVVDYLRQQQVKATFFIGGKWITTHNLRARQLMADPLFEIGNHSWIRRDLRKQEEEEALQAEVEDAERAYQKLRRDYYGMACVASLEGGAGAALAARMNLFRFPEGACNARALAAVNDAGLVVVQWDVNAGDLGRQSEQKILAFLKPRVRPGSIVQFHADGSAPQTAEALHALIPWLRGDGYRFVTVSELLLQHGAEPETTTDCSYRAGTEKQARPRRRDSSWIDSD